MFPVWSFGASSKKSIQKDESAGAGDLNAINNVSILPSTKRKGKDWYELRQGVGKSLYSGLQSMSTAIQQLSDSIDVALLPIDAMIESKSTQPSVVASPMDGNGNIKVAETNENIDNPVKDDTVTHQIKLEPAVASVDPDVNPHFQPTQQQTEKPGQIDMFNSTMVEVLVDIGKDIAVGFKSLMKQKPQRIPDVLTGNIVHKDDLSTGDNDNAHIVTSKSLLERDILELQEEFAANWEDDIESVDEKESDAKTTADAVADVAAVVDESLPIVASANGCHASGGVAEDDCFV